MSQSAKHDAAARKAQAEALLQEEFVQAWEHYRHNEQLRSQYISYAFTVTLATIAAGVPLVPVVTRSTAGFPVAGLFLLAYVLLIAFSFVAVVKIGVVLSHYSQVWRSIRRHVYSSVDIGVDHLPLDVSQSTNAMIGDRRFQLQKWSEFILASLLVVGTLAACALEVWLAFRGGTWWQLALISVTTLVTVLIAVICRIAATRRTRTKTRTGSPAIPPQTGPQAATR